MTDATLLGILAVSSTLAALTALFGIAHVLVWMILGPEGDTWQ